MANPGRNITRLAFFRLKLVRETALNFQYRFPPVLRKDRCLMFRDESRVPIHAISVDTKCGAARWATVAFAYPRCERVVLSSQKKGVLFCRCERKVRPFRFVLRLNSPGHSDSLLSTSVSCNQLLQPEAHELLHLCLLQP